MELIYISHPFTGDEENNRLDARYITGQLAKRNPDFLFINPLDLFLGQSHYMKSESLILEQALEVLRRCNGAIFCMGWRRSVGCNKEFELATKLGLPTWDGVLTFLKEVEAYDGNSDERP